VPRPPQGHPVLVQAGVSGNFQKIAAENAELIFGCAAVIWKRPKSFIALSRRRYWRLAAIRHI